ncbi:MAG: T9SS type A sorting domain-containing protein [Crocinitomicaceae bacterium]
MKKLILILTTLIIGFNSNSQEWKALWEWDFLGQNMIPSPTQMRIDPSTNKLWFTTLDKMYIIGDAGVEWIDYSDYGVGSLIEFFAVKDGKAWMPLHNNAVTGDVYSYDGTTVNLEITLGVMAYTIEFDNEDTLWIGSNNWDGISCHAFKDGDTVIYDDMNSPMLNMNIYNIFEDSYGRKWISFYNPGSSSSSSILMWDMSSGTSIYYSYYQGHNLPQFNQVIKAVQSPAGIVWIATSNGVFMYDEVVEDWIQYNTDNTNMPSNFVTDIQFDKSGKMWALFKDKALAYTYNMTDWTVFDSTNSPLNFEGGSFGIRSFTIDTLDNIWTADNDYLYVYNANGLQGWANNEELENNSQIQVYPNPATHELTIQMGEGIIEKVNIFDLSGRQLIKQTNGSNTVDVSGLSKGQYIIVVTVEGTEYVSKFVKQ